MKTTLPEIFAELDAATDADLDALSDDELRAAIARSNKLLDVRDKQRKKEAIERARAIMAEVGLLPKDLKGPFPGESGKGRPRKRAAG